ncbi:MAG: Bug family tripartite tricarboxylate transporter substrate binding protein [Xanthobacteraceae bacterium]
MISKIFIGRALLLAFSVWLLTAASLCDAAAQSVEQFYKGRSMTILVASRPGGINDLIARLTSRHLGKHIPGNPTIVVQNLHSSGLALANRIYSGAERDGSVIAVIERGVPQFAILGDANARFDPLKLTWLGSVSSYADDAYTLTVNSTFHAKTVDDLRQSGRPPARIGTTGAGATNAIFTEFAKNVMGLNVQHVRGYRGASAVFLAMQRGEADGQVIGLTSIKAQQSTLWKSGAFRPLIAFARTKRFPELPDVPTGRELIKDPKSLQLLDFAEAPFFMALPLIAPPDLPPDRAKALLAGFMATMKDPEFVADARKLNLDLSPIDGEAVRKVIEQMRSTPKDVLAAFGKLTGTKK